jgi:hypothetical protein
VVAAAVAFALGAQQLKRKRMYRVRNVAVPEAGAPMLESYTVSR